MSDWLWTVWWNTVKHCSSKRNLAMSPTTNYRYLAPDLIGSLEALQILILQPSKVKLLCCGYGLDDLFASAILNQPVNGLMFLPPLSSGSHRKRLNKHVLKSMNGKFSFTSKIWKKNILHIKKKPTMTLNEDKYVQSLLQGHKKD